MPSLEEYINGLRDEAHTLAKTEFIDWIRGGKDETDAFIKKQRLKMERYVEQLAAGEITAQQFKEYVVDVKALAELEVLQRSVATKAKAQALVAKIGNLVLGKLVTLL